MASDSRADGVWTWAGASWGKIGQQHQRTRYPLTLPQSYYRTRDYHQHVDSIGCCLDGAGGGTRTHTAFYGPRILSPVRLPFRHTGNSSSSRPETKSRSCFRKELTVRGLLSDNGDSKANVV